MFERWRYRGRHRGVFRDCYRSVEAFAEAERITAKWCSLIDAGIQRDLARAHRDQIERMLPPRRPNVVGQVLIRDYVHDVGVGPRPGFDAFDNPPSLLAHIMRWSTIGPTPPTFDPLPADVAEVRVGTCAQPLWLPLGHEPTIVFDPPAPPRASLWDIEQLVADMGIKWPTVTVRLWLRGDELDDDERAHRERLMGMAGA